MSKISPSLCDSNFASEGIPLAVDPSTSKRLSRQLEYTSEGPQDVYIDVGSITKGEEFDLVHTPIFTLNFLSEGIHLPVDPSPAERLSRELEHASEETQ